MVPVQSFSLDFNCPVHGLCEHSVTFIGIDFITKRVHYYMFCFLCEEDAEEIGEKFFCNEYSTSIEIWDICTPLEDESKPN
jgi:hypothetical protein